MAGNPCTHTQLHICSIICESVSSCGTEDSPGRADATHCTGTGARALSDEEQGAFDLGDTKTEETCRVREAVIP